MKGFGSYFIRYVYVRDAYQRKQLYNPHHHNNNDNSFSFFLKLKFKSRCFNIYQHDTLLLECPPFFDLCLHWYINFWDIFKRL